MTDHDTLTWRDWIMNPTAEDLRYSCDIPPFSIEILQDLETYESPRWKIYLGGRFDDGICLADGVLSDGCRDAQAKLEAERTLFQIANDLLTASVNSSVGNVWGLGADWARALCGETSATNVRSTSNSWRAQVGPLLLLTSDLAPKGWTWEISGYSEEGSCTLDEAIAANRETAIQQLNDRMVEIQLTVVKLAGRAQSAGSLNEG